MEEANTNQAGPSRVESSSQHQDDERSGDVQPGDNRRERDRSHKRKREAPNKRRNDKKPDMGRGAYFRSAPRKTRNEGKDDAKKDSVYANHLFSKEEIEAEERKPKKKVAVMIGYSGSGYKGMQIMPDQKTIEGDLFNAFVAAGAISKANADDPKKSSLVRCARTDKGVHAAGNVVSLKLIIEDPEIVEKINEKLDPRIRVWGIIPTTGAFNCYALCDSRWYEYLIPTYSFLPPHPSSFLSKELHRIAEEDGKLDEFNEAQKDVASFWEETERNYIKPVLDEMEPELRERVEQAMYKTDGMPRVTHRNEQDLFGEEDVGDEDESKKAVESSEKDDEPSKPADDPSASVDTMDTTESVEESAAAKAAWRPDPVLDAAIQKVKAAYISAKMAYRISDSRLQKMKDTLAEYVGTHNYHNFTIRKSAKDPSANRFIKSFEVNGSPIIIRNTEWLSLKVHGQSFMMHQIRKMVAMAALIVRSGTPISRMKETMSTLAVNIPKAPGLGLLLERPVFENYNKMKAKGEDKGPIEFDAYEEKMLAFKQKEIYDRIFEVEENENVFHSFFSQVDNFKENTFLFLSSRGLPARRGPPPARTADSAAKTNSWNQGRKKSPSPYNRKSRGNSRDRSRSPTSRTLKIDDAPAAAGASA